MLLKDLFASDVTRNIAPVVHFYQQNPDHLADEVREYIITGGWPATHPHHKRVPNGIHEQYVRLLTGITEALAEPGGPSLPNIWISGFFGSGKSSFAKLLGMALNRVALPDGRSLGAALIARDTSPNAKALRDAWDALLQRVEPIAVVFDIGGIARGHEHIHAAATRQVQARLGYCSNALVAEAELKLERNGQYHDFEQAFLALYGEPWAARKDRAFADDEFSAAMHRLAPRTYPEPSSWFESRGGTHTLDLSPVEAAEAIRDMLQFRAPGKTLFLVIDEVSQYVLAQKDRVERLRAFAEAIGARLRGQVWLLALGQQLLDDNAEDSFLVKTKDRFPPRLRVHLAPNNIRDVVHKRLLHKRDAVNDQLTALFERHRADLKLFAYGCENLTADEFVEVYPMLPGQIDLILTITTALRTRSNRSQGDDQAIRGLLQLLGELFRAQDLANFEVGALVTLDLVYEVQHTALDADLQLSMGRVLTACANDASDLPLRCAKAVALLELVQEHTPTTAELVAKCLYNRLDLGNQQPAITEALEDLRRRNLLGYSEKTGYKLQSSAAEQWEKERRDQSAPRESRTEHVIACLDYLLASVEQPRLDGRPFPWVAWFNDERGYRDHLVKSVRDAATIGVDFRYPPAEHGEDWVKRSDEHAVLNRLLWVCGDATLVETTAESLQKSKAMVDKYRPRAESLSQPRKILLLQEEGRLEDLVRRLREQIASAFMAGRLYFRGRPVTPTDHGASFAAALNGAGTRVLSDIYPHFCATQLQPSELYPLIDRTIAGPSPKLLDGAQGDLGILANENGHFEATCKGVVPTRIREHLTREGGVGGTTLLAIFGGPPYGYTPNVIKACVLGLLRGGHVTVQPEGTAELTSVTDPGSRDLIDKDRAFRTASINPAKQDEVGPVGRAKLAKFFESHFDDKVQRDEAAIADATVKHLQNALARQLRDVQARLNRLPDAPEGPEALRRLTPAIEACVRNIRHAKPTVNALLRHLDALAEGATLVRQFDAELTEDAIAAVQAAAQVRDFQLAQLEAIGVRASNLDDAAQTLRDKLRSDRPWRDIGAIALDIDALRAAYRAERERLLAAQESLVEQARARIKQRDGFTLLSDDAAHAVLRPLLEATDNTTADAIAPTLEHLRDTALSRVQVAEDQAMSKLDQLRAVQDSRPIKPFKLQLQHREVATEADVDAVVDELRARLMEHVRAGVRVRLT